MSTKLYKITGITRHVPKGYSTRVHNVHIKHTSYDTHIRRAIQRQLYMYVYMKYWQLHFPALSI